MVGYRILDLRPSSAIQESNNVVRCQRKAVAIRGAHGSAVIDHPESNRKGILVLGDRFDQTRSISLILQFALARRRDGLGGGDGDTLGNGWARDCNYGSRVDGNGKGLLVTIVLAAIAIVSDAVVLWHEWNWCGVEVKLLG